ncbi:Acireductone dioxygenase (Fe(2+)-requiring) [Serratia rubidaea]|uniref:Acireductone dioxygenase (Fe(2+)-requiring) n=1 Tax=Serratia rubidaea TaxID=61652 RepID=A0A3S4JWC9_SERRU|nr:Acireductone dioxygenase (Fe(2+)-requiring) [Serratia rubidaea]
MRPDHPQREALRQKFLSEHTHGEDEVRFFVEGAGLFCLHLNQRVYQILCEKNDLISVPAHTPHWFDMGPRRTLPPSACLITGRVDRAVHRRSDRRRISASGLGRHVINGPAAPFPRYPSVRRNIPASTCCGVITPLSSTQPLISAAGVTSNAGYTLRRHPAPSGTDRSCR